MLLDSVRKKERSSRSCQEMLDYYTCGLNWGLVEIKQIWEVVPLTVQSWILQSDQVCSEDSEELGLQCHVKA
jgi:hypothetical protein